jgi:hypothetical protein
VANLLYKRICQVLHEKSCTRERGRESDNYKAKSSGRARITIRVTLVHGKSNPRSQAPRTLVGLIMSYTQSEHGDHRRNAGHGPVFMNSNQELKRGKIAYN